MGSHPTVSVVIPTYNRASMLGRAIRSVVSQTFQDLEVLVVNDGSTDGTDAIVHSFNDERIVYLRHEMNLGGSVACNTGIRQAKGEYIALLDDDDEWLPTKLERQVELFQKDTRGEVGVVDCDYVAVWDDREVVVKARDGWLYEDLLSLRCGICASSALFRRASLDGGRLFDERYPVPEDRDFFVQIARRYKFARVPESLVRVYRHDGPHLNVPKYQLDIRRNFMHKHQEELRRRPAVLARYNGSLGKIYLALGDAESARREFFRALKLDPLNPRWAVWSVVALPGGWITQKLGSIARCTSRLVRGS